MKEKIILPILLLVSSYLIAQKETKVKIDMDGRLTSLPKKGSNGTIVSDTKKFSEELEKQEYKRLDNNFKSVKKSLTDQESDLFKFYTFIGVKKNLVDKIIRDLDVIEKADIVKNGAKGIKLDYFTFLNTIESHSISEKDAITYEAKYSETSLDIKQRNNFNPCYSEYVKKIYDSSEELLKKMDARKFLTSITYLQYYENKMDSLLSETENPRNVYNVVLLKNITTLNKYLSESKKVNELKELVNKDWFIQLAWLNNGYLRMNPFDSKSEEFIITYSAEAKERAAKFNAYIEHLLNWYIERDTTANIDKFKSILNLRNTGAQLYKPFTLEEFNNKIYSKPLSSIKPETIVLNSISKESLKCLNRRKTIFADTKNEELNSFFNAPLLVEKEKMIFVQNLGKDQTIKIDTSAKLITDRSDFQNNLDAIIEDAVQIGAVALSLSGNVGLLNQVAFKPNNSAIYSNPRQLTPSNEKEKFDRAPASLDDYLKPEIYSKKELISKIREDLIEKDQYIDSVFSKSLNNNDLNSLVRDTTLKSKHTIKIVSDDEQFEDTFLAKYYTELEELFNSSIDELISLRTNISMLCDVFSKSSLPHKLFENNEAKSEPLYQTKSIEVKTFANGISLKR